MLIKFLKKVKFFFDLLGINLLKIFSNIILFPGYVKDFIKFYVLSRKVNSKFSFSFFPILDDKYAPSGSTKGHYFTQDLYVAQEIFHEKPSKHVDVGSRIDGFVTHVASFREIEVIDIRPVDLNIDNINFLQLDFSKNLDKEFLDYTDSISCLHTLEHFGLGRYGDEIDPISYIKGLNNLSLLCKVGGSFYLSVPLGDNMVFFNAHRTFSFKYLFELIDPLFEIKNLSVIDDNGEFHKKISLNDDRIATNFNSKYGCAIFHLIKK
jgi:hypothetical protein